MLAFSCANLILLATAESSVVYQAMADASSHMSVADSSSVCCRSWTLPAATTALLDHKGLFSDYATSLGLLVPQHHVIYSAQQLLELNSQAVSLHTPTQLCSMSARPCCSATLSSLA